jgi:hypothetical protein
VLYLIDLADCPYRSIGLSADACRVTTGRGPALRIGEPARDGTGSTEIRRGSSGGGERGRR